MRVRIRRFNENSVVGRIVRQYFPVLCFANKRYSGLRVSRGFETFARDLCQLLQVLLVLSALQASPVPDSVLFLVSSVSTASVSVSVSSIRPVPYTHLAWLPVENRLSSLACSDLSHSRCLPSSLSAFAALGCVSSPRSVPSFGSPIG